MNQRLIAAFCISILVTGSAFASGNNYKNFDVASYATVRDVVLMNDPGYLESRWAAMSKYVKYDKIYLETSRDMIIADQKSLDAGKKFFLSKGLKVSGGITWTVDERSGVTFCYSDPRQLQKAIEIIQFTAKNFDEILFDDWGFTNCKTDDAIAAKGNQSWSQYRLALMDKVGRELVAAAKAVNPRVKVIIKYPQWYDHYQETGFNLETQPKYFDGIYTGTETRDPVNNPMQIQQYHGYSIARYLSNLNHNDRGGWVDAGDSEIPNRYAEQLWITLFAKLPEITLWPIGTQYEPSMQSDGTMAPDSKLGRIAGPIFEQVDQFIGKLGNPVGVKSYKPFHSSGEDYLQSYLGMIGIPMDIVPEFPTDAQTVLLTEQASFDPAIISKIKHQLSDGKTVVITSGLLKALQGKGIEDIADLKYTGSTVSTHEFMSERRFVGVKSDSEILLPQITFFTNDASADIIAYTSASKTSGDPLLLKTRYSKGVLYVLTIPNAQGDLLCYPQPVLSEIREVLAKDMFVRLDTSSQVGLYVYDNDTFIVESFRQESTRAVVVSDKHFTKLHDLQSGQYLTGTERNAAMAFEIPLSPGSYRVFAAE
ncbi:hypothetical protein [Granulicella sp. L46]|uniref:hypothetical protein n=1 Tax=Granulicella sp. L46 TaxID=1641865 RepID=UPI00131D2471|nr:hypothetical protein [Granulicella sp. L46]